MCSDFKTVKHVLHGCVREKPLLQTQHPKAQLNFAADGQIKEPSGQKLYTVMKQQCNCLCTVTSKKVFLCGTGALKK